MSSGQTKDSDCIGCTNYHQSWAAYPCNACTYNGGSGLQTSYYKPVDGNSIQEEFERSVDWTNIIRGSDLYDNVTNPKHYELFNGEKQVIDLIEDRCNQLEVFSNVLPYQYGNAIKYLMRWPQKNGVEDLRKCRQYLDMIIEELCDD